MIKIHCVSFSKNSVNFSELEKISINDVAQLEECWPDVLSLLVAVTKYPRKPLSEGSVDSAHSSKVQSIMVRTSWQQALEASGPTASEILRLRSVDAGTHFTVFL